MRALHFTLACLLAAACGGGSSSSSPSGSPPDGAAPAPSSEVALTLETPVVEQGVLRLRGTTNLPDGALLTYVVKHDGFDSGDFNGFAEGRIAIHGGRFSGDVPVDGWPLGHALIRLAFLMNPGGGDAQPRDVVERFGQKGERLQGPAVVAFGDTKSIEINGSAPIS